MRRRNFLTSLGAAAVAGGCSLCAARIATAAEGQHWSYEGAEGPEHWAGLSEDFKVCGAGAEQSPIDLTEPTPGVLGDVAVDWQTSKLHVVNNGHTIQANMDAGSRVLIRGKRFDLKQFHFHHPSEHLLGGNAQPMEIHFVHAAEDGALAVLGVFMVEGEENETIGRVWKAMPQQKGETETDDTVVPGHLLPAGRSFYRYAGSLTTPPCTEVVTWTVYADPIEASAAQIATFAALYPNNARPAQPLNRRFLLSTF